jgi:hypothetical protein
VRSIKSRARTSAFLTASALILSGCAAGQANLVIPDSLRAPCESTVDVSGAQTVGDLGRAIVQGDADLRVCSIQKDAVVAIAESQNRRPWWQRLLPG